MRDAPQASRLFLTIAVLTLSGCVPAQERWEVGTTGGAQFRMRVPVSWNRTLVLAAGGYSPLPITFRPDQSAGPFADELIRQGYAYAETGYSAGGVAIPEAIADVRALRQYFVERYGNPNRTFVVGESKGGLVALVLAESTSSEIDGALTISGLLSSPYVFFSRAFDLLVRFHEYFPDVLPGPMQVPQTYAANEQTVMKVFTSLERSTDAAEMLRTQAGVRSGQELAELLAFHTEALGDLQRRCGGNAFTDRGVQSHVDAARNGRAARARTVADPYAERCVRGLPGPTGKLHRPVVAVDTAYDPVIPSWSADEYVALLRDRGRQDLFMREVVPWEGHLNVSTADRLRTFTSLVRWSAEGVHPTHAVQ